MAELRICTRRETGLQEKRGKTVFSYNPDLRSKKVIKATHLQSALIDECQKSLVLFLLFTTITLYYNEMFSS